MVIVVDNDGVSESCKYNLIIEITFELIRLQENLYWTNRQKFHKMRCNEHKRAFRNNSHSFKFAHLNGHAHSFGTINDILQILYYQTKSPHLNTIERFYIHVESASSNHLNYSHTIFPNRIFDTVLKTIIYPSLPFPLPHSFSRSIPHHFNTRHNIRTMKPVFLKRSTRARTHTHTHTYHRSILTT